MSLQSRKISVRIEAGLMDEVSDYLLSRNCQALTPPWSLSEFVQNAIMDKLDHIKRSRRSKKKQEEPKHIPEETIDLAELLDLTDGLPGSLKRENDNGG